MVILDSSGKTLITSDGPNGNIGYPFEPKEIDFFMEMLKKTASRISADDHEGIRRRLEEYAAKKKQARQKNAPQSGTN